MPLLARVKVCKYLFFTSKKYQTVAIGKIGQFKFKVAAPTYRRRACGNVDGPEPTGRRAPPSPEFVRALSTLCCNFRNKQQCICIRFSLSLSQFTTYHCTWHLASSPLKCFRGSIVLNKHLCHKNPEVCLNVKRVRKALSGKVAWQTLLLEWSTHPSRANSLLGPRVWQCMWMSTGAFWEIILCSLDAMGRPWKCFPERKTIFYGNWLAFRVFYKQSKARRMLCQEGLT